MPSGGDITARDKKLHLSGMYENWFLDYASYVILERAVPHIEDGFKPVQRRIMHAMKEADDGHFNKVANLVGLTMQYHPPIALDHRGDSHCWRGLSSHGRRAYPPSDGIKHFLTSLFLAKTTKKCIFVGRIN